MSPKQAFEEVERVGLIVDVVPVTRDERFVWLLGQRFDAEDLYLTLLELDGHAYSTYVTNRRMIEALDEIGVTNGTSGSWGTSIKSEARLKKLISMLRAALAASKSEYV